MYRKCYLKCLEDSHEPILLPHKEEITVGRSPSTKIQNTRCSRKQVRLHADTSIFEVRVQQLGDNASAISDQLLRKHDTHVLRHGDTIELVHGLLKHQVVFEPPPPASQHTGTKASGSSHKDAASPLPPEKKKMRLSPEHQQVSTELMDQEKNWEAVDNEKMLVFTPRGTKPSSKIASYDLDWTLVGTSSGRVYPKDKDDWCILLPEVPGHLKKLHAQGYKIVIFSNQAGIGSKKIKIPEFQAKIENVIARLGVPIQAFISTGPSFYRKPALGMWEALIKKRNAGVEVNLSDSLYCGDAAGRPLNWAPKKKKDFSCSDRLFAMNIGIRFFTPEEHFQKARPAPFSLPDFKPMHLPRDLPECHPPSAKLIATSQELAIMVGSPGSGKSFVARHKHVSAGYKYVNMDELKSSQRCMEVARAGLAAGLSVVIDNTNPDIKSRARFVEIARSKKVPCRCLVMATTAAHARHNNRFRELTDRNHTLVSEMIIRTYEKNYQEPKLEEGFSEIIKVNFIPHFTDDKLKSIYEQFLVA